MQTDDNFWPYFYEIFETLPRQGPGDRESTERALACLPPLAPAQRILDIGCGTGTQTLDLARACSAQIVAVDNHAPFLVRLARQAADLGLQDRITAQVGDMNDLPFPDGSFDVVWSEGAIFIVGFAKGLSAWRRLLRPGGFLVVSELCWLRDEVPAEVKEILIDGFEDVGDVEARRKAVAASGYRLVGDFPLPDKGWWENYYVPLAAGLERFRQAHAGDAAALDVASKCAREIDVYRRHPDVYGYTFFVLQREG